jgi:hypothetical protein
MHRPARWIHSIICFAALAVPATRLAARQSQALPPTVLDRPDAVIPEPFSLIRGAVELRDGRLLVTDWIEQRLSLFDFAHRTDRGRVGAGPEEFRLPSSLFPFRGDSALLVDVGNGRLAVLGPDGAIARTILPADPAATSPGAVDSLGRIYYGVPAWRATRELKGDSVELRVLEPSGASRTVTLLHGSTSVRGPAPRPRVPFVIFAPQDGFAVTPAGRVLVVRDGDYSVHSLNDGPPLAGPSHTFARVRATAADRTSFVRQFVLSSPMSGRGEDGGLGHTPAEAATDAAIEEMVKASSFAETLPPFRAGDVRLDGQGRLWVGRFERIAEPGRYDVFDATGRRIALVQLGPDRRIIALGAAHAYVVRTDESGLQHIERHSLAPLAGRS